jgi:hypothetical protein
LIEISLSKLTGATTQPLRSSCPVSIRELFAASDFHVLTPAQTQNCSVETTASQQLRVLHARTRRTRARTSWSSRLPSTGWRWRRRCVPPPATIEPVNSRARPRRHSQPRPNRSVSRDSVFPCLWKQQ